MSLTRRQLLERLAGLGALAALPPTLAACGDEDAPGDGLPTYTWDGPLGPEGAFEHGVASGDPLADAVILWTRVSSDDPSADVDVFLEIARDPAFADRLAAATYTTGPDTGFCLKVDATDLSAGTTYYYRFSALGRTSPVGRTRTLPDGAVDRVRVGVCSCSNYAAGYFHTYHYLAQRHDLDLVLHLGDYLYEYGDDTYGDIRPCEPPTEILTLADYRLRYSQYRRDPDLAEAHRQFPWITVWDDHEFTNDPLPNGTGAENHTEGVEGVWADRVAVAIQAYDEWLPTRVRDPAILWRVFDLGDLVRLPVVDIKYPLVHDLGEAVPSMLGADQHAWLDDAIAHTTQPWLVLAQAQSFTDAVRQDGTTSVAAWGRHPTSRRRVLDAAANAQIPNVVVLTGDTHQSRAIDYTEDPWGTYDPATGAGAEAVEFHTGAISSPGGPGDTAALANWFWADGFSKMYLVLDVTRDRLQADWFGYPEFAKWVPTRPEGGESWLKGYTTASGANHLVEATAPAEPPADVPAPAP